jgi:dihydrofolate reductase
MRTLISMTYVYSVNATSMKDGTDGTEEFRFINDLPEDDDEERSIREFLAGAELYIMGRVLYEEFASHFQGKSAADHPFAPIYAATDKIVFSQSLAVADWERSTINRGDLVTEVEKLKSEGDGYMIVTGRIVPFCTTTSLTSFASPSFQCCLVRAHGCSNPTTWESSNLLNSYHVVPGPTESSSFTIVGVAS